jgi:hypothetical protein
MTNGKTARDVTPSAAATSATFLVSSDMEMKLSE